MKNVLKTLAIGLFLAGMVFAKSEQPPGSPPFGAAVQGDAKGTKLSGALFAEFHDCVFETGLCEARIVLRLRKGNTSAFAMFYGDTDNVATIDPTNPGTAQAAIIALMEPQVIDFFFGGNPSLHIKTKSLTEFGELGVAPTDLTESSQFVLTDVQIAVN